MKPIYFGNIPHDFFTVTDDAYQYLMQIVHPLDDFPALKMPLRGEPHCGVQGPGLRFAEDTYDLIHTLVQHHRVCMICGEAFTKTNPQVCGNVCLCCVYRDIPEGFHYNGSFSSEQGKGYLFRNTEGYLYRVYEGVVRRMERHIADTLWHWQFPLPTNYMVNGKRVWLQDEQWQVYGDFVHDTAVVVRYTGGPIYKVFLTYKGGTYQELDRNTEHTQRLFAEARKRAEKDKGRTDRYYLTSGCTSYYLFDPQLYKMVASIASEWYSEHCCRF